MSTGRRVVSARSLVAESDLPVHEAGRLLQSATGRSRASLARDDAIADAEAGRFESLVARRKGGEPLQYLEGSLPFGPIQVAVDPRVLIPRPETEQLWELVVALLADRPPGVIVDLGTGSGNLAIALKHQFPDAEVYAVDVSSDAFDAAAANVAAAGVDVMLYQGDLFSALPTSLRGMVDLVISNPPYVATAQRGELPREVRDHEPAIALFGGPDGLSVIRRITAEAPDWLAIDGLLACEIGSDQGEDVAALAAGMNPEIVDDISGRNRFLIARKGTF